MFKDILLSYSSIAVIIYIYSTFVLAINMYRHRKYNLPRIKYSLRYMKYEGDYILDSVSFNLHELKDKMGSLILYSLIWGLIALWILFELLFKFVASLIVKLFKWTIKKISFSKEERIQIALGTIKEDN